MMKTCGISMIAVATLLAAVGTVTRESHAQATKPATQPATQASTVPKEISLDLGDKITMKLALIPAGKFLMGSPKNEKGRKDDEGLPVGKWIKGSPQFEVTISKPFYMGVYPVTVDQYAQFAKETHTKIQSPPFPQTGDHPVVCVDWPTAGAFCAWLSRKTGQTASLPTEAQWEYACRAGTTTRFSFGVSDDDLPKYANYCDKTNTTKTTRPIKDLTRSDGFDHTSPVGSFKPNPWGLYDVHGNAWNWCSDYYADSYSGTETKDPVGPATGTVRVLRGGCFLGNVNDGDCRSARRHKSRPDFRYQALGLRVVVQTNDTN